MKDLNVISKKNLPTKIPVWSTVTAAIALDYWSAPEWVIGAVGLFFLMSWVIVIAKLFVENEIDVLEDNKKNTSKTFKEQVKDKLNS